MGYLLSLQALEKADTQRHNILASSWSTGICNSVASTGICH